MGGSTKIKVACLAKGEYLFMKRLDNLPQKYSYFALPPAHKNIYRHLELLDILPIHL